jgi:hypothetical protein
MPTKKTVAVLLPSWSDAITIRINHIIAALSSEAKASTYKLYLNMQMWHLHWKMWLQNACKKTVAVLLPSWSDSITIRINPIIVALSREAKASPYKLHVASKSGIYIGKCGCKMPAKRQ